MDMPKEVYGVLKCHNPRCISSIEQELPHIFFLADSRRKIYRCRYCEEKYSAGEREKRAREMVPLSNEVQNWQDTT